MFRKNTTHDQSELFSPGNTVPDRLKKRLENHWSTLFYKKIFSAIDESVFTPIYSSTGTPNFPANILVGLEILKEIHGLSDEQLYDRYHFDYTYQRALGVEDIEKYTFAIRTIYHFRERLAKYEMQTGENLMLDVFKSGRDKIIEELGIRTGLQRTDSVLIQANIKRMSRLSLFHKVFSNVVKELQDKKIPLSEKYTDLTKDDEDGFTYRLSSEKVSETLEMIGTMLRELMLDHVSALRGTKSYEDAERLLKEQTNVKYGNVKLKDPSDIDSSSMQNPSDTDATFRRKGESEYRGYSVHAVETCDPENKIQVITHIDTVKNNMDDARVLEKNLPEMNDEMGIEALVTDGGFISDGVRNKCDELSIDLVATAIRGKEQPEDSLTSVDFFINDAGLISACPAGHSPMKRSIEKDGTMKASFSKEHCLTCTLKSRCIAYRENGNGNITIDKHRLWLDERRLRLGTAYYLSLCGMRPPVEALMEKLKPKYLTGRVLFRGLVRVRTRMIVRAIGINFRRYYTLILLFFQILLSGNTGTVKFRFSGAE